MLNHSWNASPQSGHRSFICSQKEGMRRRTNADRQDYVEEIVWKVEKNLRMQILRTHQYSTNSKLLQTIQNLNKSFRNETTGKRNIIAQRIKEKQEKKRLHRQFFHAAWKKHWCISNGHTDG
jgi:hypothetical protein